MIKMLPSLSVYWYMTCKYCSYYNATCKNKALYPGMNEIGTNNLTGSLMQCLEKAFSAGAFQLSLSPLFFSSGK